MKEIEQLIGNREQEEQPELPLAFVRGEDEPVKLNIADGTHVPRNEDDEDVDDYDDDRQPEEDEDGSLRDLSELLSEDSDVEIDDSDVDEDDETGDFSDGNGGSDHEVIMESPSENSER